MKITRYERPQLESAVEMVWNNKIWLRNKVPLSRLIYTSMFLRYFIEFLRFYVEKSSHSTKLSLLYCVSSKWSMLYSVLKGFIVFHPNEYFSFIKNHNSSWALLTIKSTYLNQLRVCELKRSMCWCTKEETQLHAWYQ